MLALFIDELASSSGMVLLILFLLKYCRDAMKSAELKRSQEKQSQAGKKK
jgi:hypothetical protein